MVTASCRIGYDFSTPDGPLTMKLAETPSRSAGLIISVFGVASSPMASLLARKTGGLEEPQAYEGGLPRSRSGDACPDARTMPGDGSQKHHRRHASDAELLLRRWLRLRLRRRLRSRLALGARLRIGLSLRSGVLAGRELRQLGLEERLPVRLRVLVVERDHRHLALVDAGQVLALDECAALGVRLALPGQDGIAARRDEPELIGLPSRRPPEPAS